MTVRARWSVSEDGQTLLTGRQLKNTKEASSLVTDDHVWCRMYYSYNTENQQTTIFTAGHNAQHLQMIETLRQYSHQPHLPTVLFLQLLPIWFTTVADCFRTTIDAWDDVIGVVWSLSLSTIAQHLKIFQNFTTKMLEAAGDLNRLSTAATRAILAEKTRSDFSIFRNAVIDMQRDCGTTLKKLANLDDSALASLLYEFSILEKRCKEIQNLLAGMSGAYDRYLNLVRNSFVGRIGKSK